MRVITRKTVRLVPSETTEAKVLPFRRKAKGLLKASKPTNGAGKALHAVGQRVDLSPDQITEVKRLEGALYESQRVLGEFIINSKLREVELISSVKELKKSYFDCVMSSGKALGLNLATDSKEVWNYEPQGFFTRTK